MCKTCNLSSQVEYSLFVTVLYNRKYHIYVKVEYQSTLQKIKHYLTHENKINNVLSYCEKWLIWSEHFNTLGKVFNAPIIDKVKDVVITFVRLFIRVNTKLGQLNWKDVCNWYELHRLAQRIWECIVHMKVIKTIPGYMAYMTTKLPVVHY